jgi:hypothetical protein
MNNKSLVEKLGRIVWKKEEEYRNLICAKERGIQRQEAFIIKGQKEVTDHALHYGVANPTSLQVHSPNSSPYCNPGRQIKASLHILTCARNGYIFWENKGFQDRMLNWR